MSINFSKEIEQYTTIQRGARTKQFMEFTSKKQLQDAEVLTDRELKFITSIKGTFSFALHNDGRYMAITLYRATAEKKYTFLILDLQEQAIAEVGSIKQAKAEILELVEQTNKPEETAQSEDVEDKMDEALNEQEGENKKSKKSHKTA